jgi:hypothetical protein
MPRTASCEPKAMRSEETDRSGGSFGIGKLTV